MTARPEPALPGLVPGARLGPYEVVSLLGAGGMGEVYRGRDTRLRRDVALKILPPALVADPDRRRRFEQEARAASALDHPNITVVHDVGVQEGTPYVVMELLQGESLRARLRRGALPARKAVELAIQIAHGLAAAHDKGVLHRDVKPDNVFLTREGRVKLLDFGLAKLVRFPSQDEATGSLSDVDSSRSGTVVGTAGYMSPEQIRGEPVDARSDVFALGSVLYEMLCGQRAFRGATPAETMSAILKEDPPELAEGGRQIPAVLDRIVRRCLEKRPEERFQSARDVAFALEAVSAAASSVALTGRERSWPPSAMAAVIALAVLAVAAVALLAVRHRSAPPASFRQLTFRRGVVHSARFAPDGQSAVYAASWEGEPARLYVSRIGSPEVTALAVPPANVLAVSASGEIALTLATRWLVGQWPLRGTLARVPLAGGAPRELLEDVDWADWAPDGKSMAVVHAVGGRVRLEYPIGHVLHVTEGWISHPRISPDGDLVAFLDHPTEGDDGSVLVVDHAGRKTTISAGWASLQGLVWHPTRREVWFSGSPAGGNTSIWAVTLSGRQRLVSQAPARLIVHDMSRAGQLLLTREYLKAGVIGLGAGLPRERDYSWFDWTSVVDISADGTTMLLSEGGGTVQMVPWLYLRKMDGAPAARIGEGGKAWFSPDGKWVLSNDTQQLLLIPIGPGSERRIDRDHISRYQEARWFPDGTRIVFAGSETGGEIRLYVQDVAGGGPRAVGPEGLRLPARLSNPVSPDGTWITAVDAGKYVLHSLNGESARELVGLQPADQPILWADYGRILYVFQAEGLPARVYRLDVRTGRREPWKQILPPDPAGILGFPSFVLTPDQRSYAYSYARQLSELFAAEGLD